MHFHPDPKHGTKGGSPEDISIFKNIYNDQPSASAPLHLVCNNNMVYLYNGYLQSIPGLERPASKFKATLRGYKGYYELQKKYNCQIKFDKKERYHNMKEALDKAPEVLEFAKQLNMNVNQLKKDAHSKEIINELDNKKFFIKYITQIMF